MPVKFKRCAHPEVNERAIPDATPASAGVMSATDKTNLDALVAAGGSTPGGPLIPPTTRTLVDNTPRTIFTVDMTLVPDNSFACMVFAAVECTDGTNTQVSSGSVIANIAQASNGTINSTASDRSAVSKTAGTLTVTYSWSVSGTNVNFQVNANSTLVPTDLHVTFYIPYATHPAITVSAAP